MSSIELMSSKINLLSSKLNSKSKWLKMPAFPPIHIGKKKATVERTAPKVIKRPKVIGNIEEIKVTKVIKRPEIVGSIKEPKANRVVRIPKVAKVDDKCKRYVNPITLNYVLRPTQLRYVRLRRRTNNGNKSLRHLKRYHKR